MLDQNGKITAKAILQDAVDIYNERRAPQGFTLKPEDLIPSTGVYALNRPYYFYRRVAIKIASENDLDGTKKLFSLDDEQINEAVRYVNNQTLVQNTDILRIEKSLRKKLNVPIAEDAQKEAAPLPQDNAKSETPAAPPPETPPAKQVFVPSTPLMTALSKMNRKYVSDVVRSIYNDKYGLQITHADLISSTRKRPITDLRHLVFYAQTCCLPKDLYSLPMLGRFMDRDHTTVMHSIKEVQILIQEKKDKDTLDIIERICEREDLHVIQKASLRSGELKRFYSWQDLGVPKPPETKIVEKKAPEKTGPKFKKVAAAEQDKPIPEKRAERSGSLSTVFTKPVEGIRIVMPTATADLNFTHIIDALRLTFRQKGLDFSQDEFLRDGKSSLQMTQVRDVANYIAVRCLPSRLFTLETIAEAANKTSMNISLSYHKIEDAVADGNEDVVRLINDTAKHLPLTELQRKALNLADTPRFKTWQDVGLRDPVPSRSPAHP